MPKKKKVKLVTEIRAPDTSSKVQPHETTDSAERSWTTLQKYKLKLGQRNVHMKSDFIPSSLTNPLQSVCNLFCSKCLIFSGTAWYYIHDPPPEHGCHLDILAYRVQDINGHIVWAKVRERTNGFPGNYAMCYSALSRDQNQCKYYNKDECKYLHTIEEKLLWKLEQEDSFNISLFIANYRKKGVQTTPIPAPRPSLLSLIQKYGGYFIFICRLCFFEESLISRIKGEKEKCSGPGRHSLQTSKVLAFIKDRELTLVNRRKFFHQGAYFKMCWRQSRCRNMLLNSCLFAHSQVEKAVWDLQLETSISENQIVHQSLSIWKKMQTSISQGITPLKVNSSTGQDVPSVNLTEVCGLCWTSQKLISEDTGRSKCVRGHGNFQVFSVFVSLPSLREIRKLPGHLRQSTKLRLCPSLPKCIRAGCGYPHCEEELKIWQWMLTNGVKNLQDVANRFVKTRRQSTSSTGDSVILAPSHYEARDTGIKVPWGPTSPSRTQDPAEASNSILGDIEAKAYYCQYCGAYCDSDKDWDDHCMSEEHVSNVNSDSEHQWNFRQPPWGHSGNLILCRRHIDNQSCKYSYVPYMYNLCNDAHSQEELDEWLERHEWRQMKRDMARERNMFSYTESLLHEYQSQGDSTNVISKNIDGVIIECSEQDVVYISKKSDNFTWTFVIHSETALEKVALLHNKGRLHFRLVSTSEEFEGYQVAPGDLFLDVDADSKACYKVIVCFSGGMFGSFSQCVVFDFGLRPVLGRKLSVEIGDQPQQEKVKELRKELCVERWTSQNKEIIRSSNASETTDPFTHQLLLRYKEPSASVDVITSHSLSDLNQHNYVHKMHSLLELEEITRQTLIARYNLTTDVTISQFVDEKDQGFYIGRDGDLFLKVGLADYLTTDSAPGKLFFSSVSTALIAPADSHSNKVYEANFVTSRNFEFDGRNKEYIYLVISRDIAKALHVSHGQTIALELQFQMDRSFFCRMHYALDSLGNMQIVFPDIVQFKPDAQFLKDLTQNNNGGSSFLNEEQATAVKHIAMPKEGSTPPMILLGPFGTGKTETLARVIMGLLATQKDKCRILLCTQSNSAADLYITKYLHQFNKTSTFKMLRLVAEERKSVTVPEEVKLYCHLSENGTFVTPAKDVILSYHLVMTTVENALVLSMHEMYGDFTHIFVDEAGQTLECEILIPLSLAAPKTCVVLAGDVHQIRPIVYSQEARHQNFGMSLLERLNQYYLGMETCENEELAEKWQQFPLRIQLRTNYRTKSEILEFISRVFYDGPGSLKACGNIPGAVGFSPMAFYVVQGTESQSFGISYLNVAEAQEVVSRVTELLDSWPIEWGPMNPTQVAVIATYSDQVKYIRTLLRRDRSRPFLRNVDVGPIHSFQGKEKIALFISTVRTCNLLKEEHIIRALESGAGIDDLGFLSSCEQLNTALTRTRFYVAVIGDPVALCLIGKCAQVWEKYLKYCSSIGSIWPQTYSFKVIRNMAMELMQSPERQIVHLISQQCRDTFKSLGKASEALNNTKTALQYNNSDNLTNVSGKASNSSIKTDVSAISDGTEASLDTKVEANYLNQENNLNVTSSKSKSKRRNKKSCVNELSFNRETSSEDIFINLVQESLERTPQKKFPESDAPQVKHISLVLEEDGIATLLYSPFDSGRNKEKNFAIATEEDHFPIYTFFDEDTGEKILSENWGKKTLHSKLEAEPNKYFKCKISLKNQYFASATILKPITVHNMYFYGKDIELCGAVNRGHALDGDIAVVQILDPSDNNHIKGQVKGILERLDSLDRKLYLCEANLEDIGILQPINQKLPCTYVLTNNIHKPNVKEGQICVYKFGRESKIKFSHYEKLDIAKQECVLFVMRYLCWQPNFSLPCGVVVGVIRNDSSLLQGMKMTEIEHNILRSCGHQAKVEATSIFPQGSSIPTKFFPNRQDLTHSICFTIDVEPIKTMEMAFSVQQSGNSYQVGIHVADLAAFVSKGSSVDQECAYRGGSLFPLGMEPRHMLPSQAALDSCCLQSGLNRLTLSVIIEVDNEGKPCGRTEVIHSIINSKRHFSYAEVEEILLTPERSQTKTLESCLLVLDQLTTIWKRHRLGKSHVSTDLEPEKRKYPHTFKMMNELEICFNCIVARLLLARFPHETPLLVQPCPDKPALEQWRHAHACFALGSLSLTNAFLDNEVCQCLGSCTCVFNFIVQHSLHYVEYLTVLKEKWLALCEAVKDEGQNIDFAQVLTTSHESLPQVWLSSHKLDQIVPVQSYKCSNELLHPGGRQHYGRNTQKCTKFTSPLKSFIGLVVGRMLSAYIKQTPSPYTVDEMENICKAASKAQCKSANFEKDVFLLHLYSALRSRPTVMTAIIEDVNTQRLKLNLGLVLHGVPSLDINLQMLSPTSLYSLKSAKIQLGWVERIYDTTVAPITTQLSSVMQLDPDRLICNIPFNSWQRLLQTIREEDQSELISCVQDISEYVVSEMKQRSQSQCQVLSYQRHQLAPFTLNLSEGQSVSVQVCSKLRQGRLQPFVQLLQLSDCLDICLEHKAAPETCFTTLNGLTSNLEITYTDELKYMTNWLFPAIALESAHQAIEKKERVTIHKVSIAWSNDEVRPGKLTGVFTLSRDFCERSSFWPNTGITMASSILDGQPPYCNDANFSLDYLCVRSNDLTLPNEMRLEASVAAVVNNGKPVTWVGHFRITKTIETDEGLQVEICLVQSSVEIPRDLLGIEGSSSLCTVEWISKTEEYRIIDIAARGLPHSSDFVKGILTGSKPVDTVENIPVVYSRVLHPRQHEIVAECYRQPFSVVTGGFGTGKSTVIACLTHLLVNSNSAIDDKKTLESPSQLMLCGPTEESLDTLTAYLFRLRTVTRSIVRVYDAETEEKDFPTKSNACQQHCSVMKAVALHHLIRDKQSIHGECLQEQDNLPMNERSLDYKDILERAQQHCLKKAKIIMCTCITSARHIVRAFTNIKQIIMDDASLIPEMEIIVPLVMHKNVNQFAIFGDLRMPWKRLASNLASRLGLARPLLHRYADRAKVLDVQFRTTELMARFSCDHFYKDLKTLERNRNIQVPPQTIPWPGQTGRHFVFCHVGGEETWQDITCLGTCETIENKQEMEAVILMAKVLITHHQISDSSILIITATRAQALAIRKYVPERVTVCTLIESLGKEYNYVILSTVRSSPSAKLEHPLSATRVKELLGSLAEPGMVNLATTRARTALFIIGNKYTLSICQHWQSLLTSYRHCGCVMMDIVTFLKSLGAS